MIRRSKPITRVRLPPPTLAQVRDYETHQRAKRKPLPKFGPKARREKAAMDAFREALRSRTGGLCEAPRMVQVVFDLLVETTDPPYYTWLPCDMDGPHPGVHPHHVWPEDRASGRHDPDRGLWLCAAAHDACHHSEPALAKRYGLLRPGNLAMIQAIARPAG